ncbi:hypothetical protein ACROYT_G035349 [Oculina patagonica]
MRTEFFILDHIADSVCQADFFVIPIKTSIEKGIGSRPTSIPDLEIGASLHSHTKGETFVVVGTADTDIVIPI